MRNKIYPQSHSALFEELLTEVSLEYIALLPQEIDDHIIATLKKLTHFFGFDQALLMQMGKDGYSYLSHEYTSRSEENTHHIPTRSELPWIYAHIRKTRLPFLLESTDGLPPEAHKDKATLRKYDIKSLLSIPMIIENSLVGYVGLRSHKKMASIEIATLNRMHIIGAILGSALKRKEAHSNQILLLQELEVLKHRLEADNKYLNVELDKLRRIDNFLGNTPAFKKLVAQIEQVKDATTTVLILGETGVGKEVVAQTIHSRSTRSERPMISINCAAFPGSLIENELFGHEKGAFTGAFSRHLGRFELANGSTLFLDEVAELPLSAQAKLLRVLQEGQFERLGGTSKVEMDVRVVAATNKNLEKMVQDGLFRADLYFRLNVYPLQVPPLRKRRDDIPLLVQAFIEEFQNVLRKSVPPPTAADLLKLQEYSWPGNVRELRNIIERAVLSYASGDLKIPLPRDILYAKNSFLSMLEMEKEHIITALELCQGKVGGAGGAAELLQLNRSTLLSRMRKLKISRNINYR